MEAITLISRLQGMSASSLVTRLSSSYDAVLGTGASLLPMSLTRRFLLNWLILYVGGLLLYFIYASLDYFVIFILFPHRLLPANYVKTVQVRREISMSVKSMAIMALLSTPAEVAVQLGYSKVYTDPERYGRVYLILSPIIFLFFSDCFIYFVHRGLHHRWLYKYIHKPHHSFINTTPFAAFAFHPVDGYMQGIAYQLFVFLFPFHESVHILSLAAVGLWTINIHDRVSLGIPGVNGAAHHTIHHMTFRSNYGQYFTLWDRLLGTYRDPWLWKASGEPSMSEKDVYGKDA